jgi:uncharacterized protein (DUF58 family)
MLNYPTQLVVREFEDPDTSDVCLILDTAITPPEAEEVSEDIMRWRLEKAICFTVALAHKLVRLGYRIRFVTWSAEGRRTLEIDRRRGVKNLERLLAELEPTTDRSGVAPLLARESSSGQAGVLFLSLRETAEEVLRPRLSVLTITPDWVAALTQEVVGS